MAKETVGAPIQHKPGCEVAKCQHDREWCRLYCACKCTCSKNLNTGYCQECAEERGIKPTFDALEIGSHLKPFEQTSVNCLNCSMQYVGKDKDGRVTVGYTFDGGNWEDPIKMVPWEDRAQVKPSTGEN